MSTDEQVAVEALTFEPTEAVYVPVADLKPNRWNPNRQSEHEFELLCRSMEEAGFTTPILAQTGTNVIIDGEHRWRAASAIGLVEIPVVFRELNEVQMRIATLAHNRARGTEDLTLSADVIRQLDQSGSLGWAQDALLMDDTEAELMLAMAEMQLAPPPANPQEYNDLEERRRQEVAEEKELAAQDSANRADRFILRLVYTPEEAAIVQAVIGDKYGEGILQLCKEVQSVAAD